MKNEGLQKYMDDYFAHEKKAGKNELKRFILQGGQDLSMLFSAGGQQKVEFVKGILKIEHMPWESFFHYRSSDCPAKLVDATGIPAQQTVSLSIPFLWHDLKEVNLYLNKVGLYLISEK